MAIDPKKVAGGLFKKGPPDPLFPGSRPSLIQPDATTAPRGTGDPMFPNAPPGLFSTQAGDKPYGISQNTPGPYDQLREQMPEGYDEGDWNRFVNLLNTDYRRATPGEREKLLKRSVGELLEYGKSKNAFPTPRQKQKQKAVSDIQESNAGLTAVENEEYQKLKGEVAGAKTKDEADLAALTGSYKDLNKQDQSALADYLSATDPMMAEIFARTSDPADIQRQLDAYNEQKGVVDKYKSLTDPTVTAQERYMSELARREFEAADKSNRAAVSEQMANRGLRSGGQEIAANQSMQQQLAQDRLLKELGIQGQAVGRSMQAMEGWSNATNQLGVQSGAIRSANDSQRRFEDNFKANDAIRRQGLAGERRTATTDTTSGVAERDRGIYDASTGMTGTHLQREGELGNTRVKNFTNRAARQYDEAGILADYLTDEEETEAAFANA